MAVSTGVVAVSKTTETPYKLDPDQVCCLASALLISILTSQTLKASKALLSHVQAEAKKLTTSSSKKSLLATQDSDDEDGAQDDEEPIWLNLSTKQHIVDKNRLKPSKISIPHTLNLSEDLNICLITTDPQRAVKNVVADPTFPTSLSTKINRIIGVTKLQARYKTFESRRQLVAEHDIFLADDRIITRLPAILGKTFYKGTAKRPIPISIAPKKTEETKGKQAKRSKEEKESAVAPPHVVASEIEKALNSVTISLKPGTNVSVRIGLASFTPQQLAENVAAVVPKLIEKHVVKGWRNVRSVNIKSPTSMAVPIWLSDELWAEDENVIGTDSNQQKAIEDIKEEDGDKKRKRNPATTKGPQTGQRKKTKTNSDEDELRKKRLANQKTKVFAES